jgi:hypothetical protein
LTRAQSPGRSTRTRFSAHQLEALDGAKSLGVRSGSSHRYTTVWVVVVEGRVFVRSWNDKQSGWFRAFLADPNGMIRLRDQEIAVRGIRSRSQRLRQGVTAAYAAKYESKASRKWVQGFAEPARLDWTLELVPR